MKCPICGAEIDVSNHYRCSRFPVCSYTSPLEDQVSELEDKLSNYIIFDLETTGFSRDKDRIIEIGAIKVKGGRIVDRYDRLANPGKYINSQISNLTGITNKMLEPEASESVVVSDFIAWCGDMNICITHNGNSFDIPFLKKACRRADAPFGFDYSIDTLVLAKKYIKDTPNFKQETLAQHYGVKYKAHRAVNDCEALKEIFKKLKKEIESTGNTVEIKKI